MPSRSLSAAVALLAACTDPTIECDLCTTSALVYGSVTSSRGEPLGGGTVRAYAGADPCDARAPTEEIARGHRWWGPLPHATPFPLRFAEVRTSGGFRDRRGDYSHECTTRTVQADRESTLRQRPRGHSGPSRRYISTCRLTSVEPDERSKHPVSCQHPLSCNQHREPVELGARRLTQGVMRQQALAPALSQ
jgi:hypothetical protein